MNKEQILIAVNDVLKDIFDNAQLQISESTSSKDVEGWDSLKHIIIVSVIEKHFNVKFALGEIESLKNIGEMVELIASKLVG